MIDETLTMIPGPSPVHRRILEALGRPTVSHVAPAAIAAIAAARDGLQKVCRTRDGSAVIVAGGGTLAMEMALVNVVAPGERVLVISQGYFGDRYVALTEAFGYPCDVLRCEWGGVVAPEELAAALTSRDYGAVTITHVDTSSGAASPVPTYAEVLRGRGAVVILDGVCATAGIDERFDEWGIDVLLTASQKAIGAPPGSALCVFSPEALAKRRRLGRVPAYYADVLRWLPIMEDPSRYFATPAVNQCFAVAEAFAIVLEEGLDARFARHSRLARAFRAGLEALDIEVFTAPHCRADTLTVALAPAGIEEGQLRRGLAERGITVAAGLGPLAGHGFRVGHMGNISDHEILATLGALETVLLSLGVRIDVGSGVGAAERLLGAEFAGSTAPPLGVGSGDRE
jgi:alanine-glyoxylate transaminase / serine-glyoxylate transaminase / serine-pyruvate transaminase